VSSDIHDVVERAELQIKKLRHSIEVLKKEEMEINTEFETLTKNEKSFLGVQEDVNELTRKLRSLQSRYLRHKQEKIELKEMQIAQGQSLERERKRREKECLLKRKENNRHDGVEQQQSLANALLEVIHELSRGRVYVPLTLAETQNENEESTGDEGIKERTEVIEPTGEFRRRKRHREDLVMAEENPEYGTTHEIRPANQIDIVSISPQI
jgi:tRNA G10  N-methylase Trm11